jgi:hypothetical protein
VENYTRRNLTVASDRLPAIAGIAQKFKTSWSDEYCAGIWKRQFIASLSWRRKPFQQSSDKHYGSYWPPLSEYRAPSWSWASIEGPVEFESRLDLGNMRGLGVKLTSVEIIPLRDQAPLGEVRSGEALFEASLIPARDVLIRGGLGQDAEAYRIGGQLILDNHTKDSWPSPQAGCLSLLDDDLKEHA